MLMRMQKMVSLNWSIVMQDEYCNLRDEAAAAAAAV